MGEDRGKKMILKELIKQNTKIILLNDLIPEEYCEDKTCQIITIIDKDDYEKALNTITDQALIIQGVKKTQIDTLMKKIPDLISINLTNQDKKEILQELNIKDINLSLLTLLTTRKYYYCKINDINLNSLSNHLGYSKSKNDYELLNSLINKETITTTELKKLLTTKGLVNSIRTADRRISDWLEESILLRVTTTERNFKVKLNQNY